MVDDEEDIVDQVPEERVLPQRLEDLLPLQHRVDEVRVGGKRACERHVEHLQRRPQEVRVRAQGVLGNVGETSGCSVGLAELFCRRTGAARLRARRVLGWKRGGRGGGEEGAAMGGN